jgi:hypothetical protein
VQTAFTAKIVQTAFTAKIVQTDGTLINAMRLLRYLTSSATAFTYFSFFVHSQFYDNPPS